MENDNKQYLEIETIPEYEFSFSKNDEIPWKKFVKKNSKFKIQVIA